jgi:heme/copper-type cytochrome/quinol oxidase subunit 1
LLFLSPFPPLAVIEANYEALSSSRQIAFLSPAILAVGTWALPGVFGFWVGFRLKKLHVWSQLVGFGVLVGTAPLLGTIVWGVRYLITEQAEIIVTAESLIVLGAISVPASLLYVSGALIGNARQRRRTGRISGTTPASPVSRTTPSAGQPRKDLTPTMQAIIGWGGSIISALITLVGTIITVRSGP